MPKNLLTADLRLRELEERLPIAFRWFTGDTQPPVGNDEIVFWEDRSEDVAKIIMRRKSRVYVFSAYPFDPGESNVTITLEDHAHRHATGNSTKVDVGTDLITPFSFTWTHQHLFQPSENLTPIIIDMSNAGTTQEPDANVTPLYWFRANDIGLADGVETTQWLEKTGTGKNLIKYGGHNGPDYTASAQNSLGGVIKTGTTHLGFLTGFTHTTDYTVFIVYKAPSSANPQIWGNDVDTGPTGSSNMGFEVAGTGAGHELRCFISGTSVTVTESFTSTADFNIAVFRRESNSHSGFFNGVDQTLTTPATTSGAIIVESIFSVDADSISAVNTEILEIIGYNQALSDGEIGAIFNSLNSDYALGYSTVADTAEMFLGRDSGGTTQVTLNKDGELGLAVTPLNRLHVRTDGAVGNEQIRLDIDADNWVKFHVENDGDFNWSNDTFGQFFKVKSSGNIGIPFTPIGKFNIIDDTGIDHLRLSHGSAAGSTHFASFKVEVDSDLLIDCAETGNILLQSTGAGNVGIGTAAPLSGLHSAKVIRADQPLTYSDTLSENMTLPATNIMLMIDQFIVAQGASLTMEAGSRMRVF